MFLIQCLLALSISMSAWADEPSTNVIEPIPLVAHPTESPLYAGLDLQYSAHSYNRYSFSDVHSTNQSASAFHLSLEWLLMQELGKAGLGLGIGWSGLRNVELEPNRYASLYSYPLQLFGTFRADVMKNQILVPFVKAGLELTFAQQQSATGLAKPGTQRYYGVNYGLGLEFCLNNLDTETAQEFDSSIGVNNTYFIFEYLRSDFLDAGNSSVNLTRQEYRAGLRFEM